jgi:hypothetical protein
MSQGGSSNTITTNGNGQVETPKAARAFADYVLLGPDRSLAKLVDHYGHPPSYVRQLQRWSALFHWQDRLRQIEEQEAEQRRKKRLLEQEKMDERHATMGQLNAMIATNRIDQLIKEGELNGSAAVSLLRIATDLERLARGAATSRIEGDVTLMVQPKEYVNLPGDDEGGEP